MEGFKFQFLMYFETSRDGALATEIETLPLAPITPLGPLTHLGHPTLSTLTHIGQPPMVLSPT